MLGLNIMGRFMYIFVVIVVTAFSLFFKSSIFAFSILYLKVFEFAFIIDRLFLVCLDIIIWYFFKFFYDLEL